ncbi:ABC transporter ATP-binding protein [Cohnella pontilimi]|uniref:ABC transporter ATP-binding protein n=1 Tax=Cohnella pontilimi TaxID=2564100 RepID=A0A4U0F9S3_9BACL|nr:ABC transporter ATP-binding protein [Cohnella pontilimi]TJY39882.1 ABC transporter ATP-binding protein [Cohnella pontilimi]
MSQQVPALRVTGLTGGYSLRSPVLHDVSFEVREGEMVGLIGLNGAGKSTAIRHVLGLMTPQKGEVRVCGVTLTEDRERYRQSCAYVPEQPVLFSHLTVREHLRFTATAYAIERETAERRAADLARDFRMTDALDALPDTLSKGMKQKTMLMNALLVSPPLLIIDEPLLGLDPLAIRGLLSALEDARKRGCAILLSSHILPALERHANRLIVLHRGRIVAQGTASDVKRAAGYPEGEASLDDAFEALVLAAEQRTGEGGTPGV